MGRQIIVYRHGHKSESGFKTPRALVYLVRQGVLRSPVRLVSLGISNYRFGRYIDEEQFVNVLKAAGHTPEYRQA